MTVDEIYFQCARAIVRSELWNPDKRIDPGSLPTPGQILADMSENRSAARSMTGPGRSGRGRPCGRDGRQACGQ